MEWQPAVAGAVAALLGRILFDWLKPSPHSNAATHHRGNGVAGDRSVEYWQQHMRAAVRDELVAFEGHRLDGMRKMVKEEIIEGARREVDRVIREEFERDPRRRKNE